MAKLPPGYRFIPTYEQLIDYYLVNKVKNLPLPSAFVVERDLYGTLPPWDLLRDETDPWQTTPVTNAEGLHMGILDRTIYVLTRLKKVSRNRISRTAGCGVWHGDGVIRPILDDEGTTIGTSRSFVFKVTDEKVQDRMGHWIMHELALPKEHEGFEQQYVICKITRDDSKPLKICPKRPRPSSSGEEEEGEEGEQNSNKNSRKKQKQHDNNNEYKHHLSAAAQVVPENNNTTDQDFFNGLHEMMNLPSTIADGWMFGIHDESTRENVSSVQQESFPVTSDDQIAHGYSNVNDLDYILSAEASGNNMRSCSFALNSHVPNLVTNQPLEGSEIMEMPPATAEDGATQGGTAVVQHEQDPWDDLWNIEDFLTSENDVAFEQQQQHWLNITEDQPIEAASNSHVPNLVMNQPLEGSEIMEIPPAIAEDEATQGGTVIVQHEEDPWDDFWNTEDFLTSENDGAFEQQQQHWLNIDTEDFPTSENDAAFEQQLQPWLNITEDQPMEAASNCHVPNHVMNQPLEGSGIMKLSQETAEDESTQGGTAVVQHEEDPWDDFWTS